MPHRLIVAVVFAIAVAWAPIGLSKTDQGRVSPAQRKELIKRAQVWKSSDVASKNLIEGPERKDRFAPGQMVTCDYSKKNLGGETPKFACDLTKGDSLKVRYGRDNGEVYAQVAASRLLWALGFGADANYPVRVICRGCPREIGIEGRPEPGQVYLDIATIERKGPGHEIETKGVGSGWSWHELDLVDEASGGAPVEQRDALKLLAVLLQHSDNKAAQQKLVCLDSHAKENLADCGKPFLFLHDVGETFGTANLLNRNEKGSVNFEKWNKTPIWKDASRCVGNLSPSQTGTLSDPTISEGGRRFLSNLLAQLSDDQLRDLFTVARFADKPGLNGAPKGAPVQEWVDAFKKKREEIAAVTCK